MDTEYMDLVQAIAEDLAPIMKQVDRFIDKFDMKDMERVLGNMESHAGSMEVWPMPETMRRAKHMKAVNSVMSAFLALLGARIAQREALLQSDPTPGEQLLRYMGMI